MGRENLEDFSADFLVMLEAWDAAEMFLSRDSTAGNSQAIDTAHILGWTRPDDHMADGQRLKSVPRKLMAIAKHESIQTRRRGRDLPASWSVLGGGVRRSALSKERFQTPKPLGLNWLSP